MASPRFSTRMGLYTLLLSVMAVALFGSLVAADRALDRSQRELAELDARASALLIARELRLRAEGLGEFFDPLIAPGEPERLALVRDFRAVWVFDSTGRDAYSRPGDRGADTAGRGEALAAVRAGGRRTRVRVQEDGRVFIAVPLAHRGQQLGYAVGVVPVRDVLGAVHSDSARRPWLAIETGGRPAGIGDAPFIGRRASAPIPVFGDTLQLVIARSTGGEELRRVLWALGALALVGLMLGLARARRQTESLAARTAELERLYQEVARSNRMKSEFLANVSHELRTPLNAIVGFVEMLRDGVYGEMTPRQALPVDRIAASATHLRQLVDRLLDIAKIAAGRLEVHVEPVVLRPFVLNVASEMESLLAERGLNLSISVSPTLPRIRTDQTHLRQIIINLIGNAVKYTATGGVTVRGAVVSADGTPRGEDAPPPLGAPPTAANDWVALAVTDTGVGIADEDRERIFDEFEQVNAGARTDSARRGTGLGLAISRRLARLLGGDVTVVSAPGRGSTFTVWLPLEHADDAEASPEPRVRTSA